MCTVMEFCKHGDLSKHLKTVKDSKKRLPEGRGRFIPAVLPLHFLSLSLFPSLFSFSSLFSSSLPSSLSLPPSISLSLPPPSSLSLPRKWPTSPSHISAGTILRWIEQIVSALGYIHTQKIIHR